MRATNEENNEIIRYEPKGKNREQNRIKVKSSTNGNKEMMKT